MSQLNVNIIKNEAGTAGPTLSGDVTITGSINTSGIITASSFSGNGANLTGVGLGTTGSINTSGIITATSFSGNGANLTGVGGTSVFAAGTAAAPSISPTGDSNTGIFFPAADTIAVSAGGTERVRITAAGLMGVGTVSPSGKLTVQGGTTSSSAIVVTDNTNYTIELGRSRDNTGSFGYIGGTSGTGLTLGSNDLERVRIDTSGRLLVGTTSSETIYGDQVKIQIKSTDASAGISIHRSQNGAASPYLNFVLSRAGAIVSNNDELGLISFIGHDGTDLNTPAASIKAQVDGTPGANDMPGRLVFSTTADGAASPTERMRISANGNVNVVGALSKGSGSFRIDHPLSEKKDTHHLIHSFIEGPQADLIYRGHVNLINGKAIINIDEAARMAEGTFNALCTNVCCFTSNESDWTAVRGSVSDNILTIEAQDLTSTAEVCWMVIGERKDQHMLDTNWTDENGRVITEPLKEVTPSVTQ